MLYAPIVDTNRFKCVPLPTCMSIVYSPLLTVACLELRRSYHWFFQLNSSNIQVLRLLQPTIALTFHFKDLATRWSGSGYKMVWIWLQDGLPMWFKEADKSVTLIQPIGNALL